MRKFSYLLCCVGAWLGPAGALWACPTCKDSVSGDLAKGFSYSVLFMLAVPLAVIVVIGWIVVRSRRKDANEEKPSL